MFEALRNSGSNRLKIFVIMLYLCLELECLVNVILEVSQSQLKSTGHGLLHHVIHVCTVNLQWRCECETIASIVFYERLKLKVQN